MQIRILLLGDADARPQGLERALIRAGFVLSEAEVLPTSPGDGGSPDLIIFSVGAFANEMPDGLLPVTDPAWRNVPTIVLLPFDEAERSAQALSLGAIDVMVGPIDLSELLARVVVRLRGVRDGVRPVGLPEDQGLFSVFRNVAMAFRPEEMLQLLVKGIADSLDAAWCECVFVVDSEHGRVVASAERPEVRNHEIILKEYPELYHGVTTGKSVFVPDVAQHPLYLAANLGPFPAGFRPTSALAVPMAFQGKQVGFVVVRTTNARPNLSVHDVVFVETLVTATARLLEQEDRRANQYRRQANAGLTDPLTGCGGLDALDQRVRDEMRRAERYARPFALVLLDVIGLRAINRRLGVEGGDRILSELGALFQNELRSPDFVARYGGDEFAMILPETTATGAQAMVERLRMAIDGHTFGEVGGIGIEAGWVCFPETGVLNPEDLLAKAEAALQSAKKKTVEAA